jgi:uncharacterized protein (DUF1697 family)
MMITYVAFLRGINVGGRNLIRMDELARIFTSIGLRNVRTYIQSGNVIFDHTSANAAGLRKKIEKAIFDALGFEVTVIPRPLPELEAIFEQDCFSRVETGPEAVPFVVFLSDDPQTEARLPLISVSENIEVFDVKDRVAFALCRPKKNGLFGFPNKFVEKALGVAATTRNPNTVRKIIDLAQAESKSKTKPSRGTRSSRSK